MSLCAKPDTAGSGIECVKLPANLKISVWCYHCNDTNIVIDVNILIKEPIRF